MENNVSKSFCVFGKFHYNRFGGKRKKVSEKYSQEKFFQANFIFSCFCFCFVAFVLCFFSTRNYPDNEHFMVDPPPPPRVLAKTGGGSEFWDKIVNFGFYDLKKILVRIWDRPDLPARYRPISGHYRPIFRFWNLKICRILLFLSKFTGFWSSELDFGLKMHKIDKTLFSGLSLGPKDVFYWVLGHFRKSKILTFKKFLSCYAVSYPKDNSALCKQKHYVCINFQNSWPPPPPCRNSKWRSG